MSVFKRLAAIYMLLVAVAVAAHFPAHAALRSDVGGHGAHSVASPRPVDGDRRRGCADCRLRQKAHIWMPVRMNRPVSREYLSANAMFYYSAALLIALLYNWFGVEFADPPNDDGQVWILIDTTLPVLLAASGVRLLRE